MSMSIVKVNAGVTLTGNYENDLEVGTKIRDAAESLQFMLGDWVLEMTKRHDESVRTLAADMTRVTGVPANTLRDYAQVARAFSSDARASIEGASWSHFREAAHSSAPVTTLRAAVKQGLNVRDTARLAKGLPIGGEVEAKATSSAANAGANLEETALLDIETARLHLQRALDTIGKSGFRLTVAVGQDIMGRLEAASKPFVAIEEAVKAEVGALL